MKMHSYIVKSLMLSLFIACATSGHAVLIEEGNNPQTLSS